MDRCRVFSQAPPVAIVRAFWVACACACAVSGCSLGKLRERRDEAAPAAVAPVAAPADPDVGDAAVPALLAADEVTPALGRKAAEVLDANAQAPYGTEIEVEVDGRRYVATIEEHFHPPGGVEVPWGPHKGVTLRHAGGQTTAGRDGGD